MTDESSAEQYEAVARAIDAAIVTNSSIPPDYIWIDEEVFNNLKQEAILNKTLCGDCVYLMRGNPAICNAFHPQVGITDCVDFLSRQEETSKRFASLSVQWNQQTREAIANSFQPFVTAITSPEFQSSLRAISNSFQSFIKAAQAAEAQAKVNAINGHVERVQDWNNNSDRPSYSRERLASSIEEFQEKQKEKEKAEKLRKKRHLAKFNKPSYLDGVRKIFK